MTLQQFYNDYAAWLDAGAPEDDKHFTRGEGLCSQAMKPPYRVHLSEIKKQFVEAGLDSLYPFGGEYQFDIEFEDETMHLNPLRIQWVKDHANNQ